MALEKAVGSFNIGTGAAASTVAITGLGFQPKVIKFFWSGVTAATNGTRQTSAHGKGWACSSSLFGCAATRDLDAAGGAVTAHGIRTDACIGMLADNATWGAGTSVGAGWADLQSFDSDGFTLEILDAFPSSLYVSYLALGGSAITDAECGVFTATGTAPANQTVNNSGSFQPDITFLLSASVAADAPTATTDSTLSYGAAIGTTEYHWAGGANSSTSTGDTASWAHGGEILSYNTNIPSSAQSMRAEFVSHNAGPGGFTINWLERNTADRVLWLSIKGAEWAIGDLLTQTDTTTAITESGFGFTPAAVLVMSAGRAQSTANSAPATHEQWSMGVATSASARAVQYLDSRSGNTDMYVHLAARSDAVYVNTDPAQTAFTEVGRMDVQSFDSDGVTFIMDDADPAQKFAWYVAVGEASSNQTADAGPNTITLTAPTAARVAGSVSQAAGTNTLTLTAPTATKTSPRTATVDTNSLTLTAPTASAVAGNTTRDGGSNLLTFTAPPATYTASVTVAAGSNLITLTAPDALLRSGITLAAGVNTLTFTAPTAVRLTSVIRAAGPNALTLSAPTALLWQDGMEPTFEGGVAAFQSVLFMLYNYKKLWYN